MGQDEFNEHLKKLLEPLSNSGEALDGRSLRALFDAKVDEHGLTEFTVATLLNIERKSLTGILDRTAKRVDVVNLIKLSKFLNIRVGQLLELFVTELPSDSIGELDLANKSSFIMNTFDLANLSKAKFINNKSDIDHIEKRITKYFGCTDIFQYTSQVVNPAFSKTKRSVKNLMRDFWVASAYAHFQKINNPNLFDRQALVDLIPKIRPYTRNEEQGLLIVIRALYNIGITVIYQPHLPTVQARGATFVVDGKPCIVLSDLYKKYPTIWFGLIHELYHVLYDLEHIATHLYHLTGDPDLFLIQDDAADEFAREYLCSAEQCAYIFPFINEEIVIRQFADENQIHPSIIYSFYCTDYERETGKKIWGKFSYYIPQTIETVKNINVNVWEKETIEESAKMIKETVLTY